MKEKASNYAANISKKFKGDGFKITYDIGDGDDTLLFMANKRQFNLMAFGYTETFYVFHQSHSASAATVKRLSRSSFAYVNQLRPWESIAPEWGHGHKERDFIICNTVILVDGIKVNEVQAILNIRPPSHLFAFEIPVVYDLESNTVYNPHKSPWFVLIPVFIVGYFFYNIHLKKILELMKV